MSNVKEKIALGTVFSDILEKLQRNWSGGVAPTVWAARCLRRRSVDARAWRGLPQPPALDSPTVLPDRSYSGRSSGAPTSDNRTARGRVAYRGRPERPAQLLPQRCMKPWRLLGLCLVVATAAGLLIWLCRPQDPPPPPPDEPPPGPPWFADVTESWALDFVHDAGPVGSYFMPQALGSGAALFDCDGDGLLDIYLVNNGGPQGAKNRLVRQQREGQHSRFVDISAGSGLDVAGHGMGVAVGDVNNDGRPDVLVTEYGRIRLFLNEGKGKFKDVTREAGLDNPAWGTSAAFFDYNRDGWLDLIVVNYVDYDPTWPCTPGGKPEYCAPKIFPGRVSRLFRNVGTKERVRFKDVTLESGLGKLAGPGLGVLCADFNGDGWPDIFIANDGQPNRLWINQNGKTFKDEAIRHGVAYNRIGQPEAGMGVALGDVNGDGRFDLFVTHLTEETHTLWIQEAGGFFVDSTAAVGLASPRWRGTGFGTAVEDFDHDGAPDIVVANGRIARAPRMVNADLGPHWGLYAERNQLFANDGRGFFRDVSRDNPARCGTPNVARGRGVGDIDGDGALDLLVTTIAGRARLYRNVAPNRGHWLIVRAVDPALHRDAYGAEVRVRAGRREHLRLINPAFSYLCSNDARAHFGLGGASHVDEIEIRWPDGKREVFEGRPADRAIVLHRGEGKR